MDALDIGLLIALGGLLVAGLAAIIGIWVERDSARPIHWAVSLSILILMATIVSMYQSFADSLSVAKMEEDLARMLQRLDVIATNGSCDGLDGLISEELATQSRSNPEVVDKLKSRVEADGGDASELLGKHLPASELAGQKGIDADKASEARSSGNKKLEDQVKKLEAQIGSLKKKAEAAEAEAAENKKKVAAAAEKEATKTERIEAQKLKIEELKEELRKAKVTNVKGKEGGTWNKG